jgi:hypothetical protein
MRKYVLKWRYSNEIGCLKNNYRYRKVPFDAAGNEEAKAYAKSYIQNIPPKEDGDIVNRCIVCFSTCKSFATIEL